MTSSADTPAGQDQPLPAASTNPAAGQQLNDFSLNQPSLDQPRLNQPSLEVERELLAAHRDDAHRDCGTRSDTHRADNHRDCGARTDNHRANGGQAEFLVGVDEVGRGALAGPVCVGVVVSRPFQDEEVTGVNDSKKLRARQREELVPIIQRWAFASAVGSASPAEIDALGVTSALRLAGHRAWVSIRGQLPAGGSRLVLLDGVHDWFSEPPELLGPTHPEIVADTPPVVTLKAADLRCTTVASASVLAKVHRDELMTALATDYPGYQWEKNKGYGSTSHREAVQRLGPSPQHRRLFLRKILAAN